MSASAAYEGARQGADQLRERLVQELVDDGTLRNPEWITAFKTVARHAFLRRFFLPREERWSPVSSGDPGWLDHVYADEVLVTQLDGDSGKWTRARRDGPVSGTPTCSSSMPSIMAVMLEELDAVPGHRVLEVGTGTGYNTALLCERLGSARVSTVDVDPSLGREAEAALNGCGYRPVSAITDGTRGLAGQAPFDRVLLTCSVSRFPAALVGQTRRGGYLVSTLNRPIGAGLVRLTAGDGVRAKGPVLAADGRFMPLRAHRHTDVSTLLRTLAPSAAGSGTPTVIPARTVVNPASPFEFFAGLLLPGVLPARGPDEDSTYLLHADGSWACQYPSRGGFAVDQGGPRRLWDDVESGYRLWKRLGKPDRTRFGVTVTPAEQYLWLDDPDSEHRWPL